MSTLWFVNGASCVVTNADDETLFSGTTTDLLPGLAGTIFETRIDSAIQSDEGVCYLFCGDQYGRYSLATNALDDGYPLSIGEHWTGTAGTPIDGLISAACMLTMPQAVLFSGSEVMQYNMAFDTSTPMQPVADVFSGMPFDAPVSAAVRTDTALYLFSGDQYYRLANPCTTVDEGYPLPVEGNWPALSGFAVGGGFTLRNNVDVNGLVVSAPAAPDEGAFASIPARGLTIDQANQILQGLHAQGALTLKNNPFPGWISLDEPVLHGVEFRYWNGTITQRSALRNLDPRNAVGMARLAFWLSTNYGATTISHIGVNGDDTHARIDCHGQGRAVDFAGVSGSRNGADFDLNVLRDWGSKSVPNEQNPAGPRLPQWPPGNRTLTFRLIDNPDSSEFAANLFQAIYDFVAGQWQDGNDQPIGAEPVSIIGQRSFVMNPDHPASNPGGKSGREAHANHLHMQIGKTGTQ